MKLVVQRVGRAEVRAGGEVVGAIGRGLMILAGVGRDTRPDDVDWLARKIGGLRIFPDDTGRMNRSVKEVGGAILLVSQFTLFGDARKGRRPSFVSAAEPDMGEVLFERLRERLESEGIEVATGVFGAQMQVELVNDGPVTLILERSGSV
ncbi:MAG: D-tyrosyl-tRNA(Tyr) deacylase [Gemmatimonadetes bacterium]|nr:D-tyrosyl-tRNA(Tyr) deacylase [Gemmatimonadota bacterium]